MYLPSNLFRLSDDKQRIFYLALLWNDIGSKFHSQFVYTNNSVYSTHYMYYHSSYQVFVK
jgi:hypothetical protein